MSAAPVTRRAVRAWLLLFAAPLLWVAHLGLLYAVATVEITLRLEAGVATRASSVLLTLLALAAIAALGWALHTARVPRWTWLQGDLAALWRRAGMFLAILSFLGVGWQGLVAVLVPGAPRSHHALWGGAAAPDWVHRERATEPREGAPRAHPPGRP